MQRKATTQDLVVGLPTGQRVGGKVKGFHHEADGVDNVHSDGSYFTDGRGPEALDGNGDLNGITMKM